MCKEGQVKEDLLQKIFRNAKDELSQVGTCHLLQTSFRLSTAAVSPNTGPFAAVTVNSVRIILLINSYYKKLF